MFDVETRDRVRERVLALAAADPRIVAAAQVGSLALGGGDRWSDLDLTFAVDQTVPVSDVLADWSRTMVDEYDATHLFDISSGTSIYRVFLLPGCLQLDLSFTPAASFGAVGPKWKLLWGEAVDKPYVQPPAAADLFGYAVHHALRARLSIQRGQYWQAEYWISSLRDYALSLACLRRGLPADYGRGFDRLPAQVRDAFTGSLVTSFDRPELMRALGNAIDGLLREGDGVRAPATHVEPRLRMLQVEWDS